MSRPIIGRALTARALLARSIISSKGSGGLPPILFCTPLPLTLAPFQQFATSIITGSDVVFSGTSDGVDAAVSGLNVGTFKLLGGDVWFEWTITSANANAGIGNCPNAFTEPPPFAEGVIVVVNAAGTEFEMYKCSDIFSAPPPIVVPQNPDFINKTLNFPYTVQTRMNGTTGEITWEDTNGNSGSLGLWTAILTANLDITIIGFGNTLALTQVDASYSVNAGRAAPVITPPLGFDTWCSYAPVPPPILCGSLLPLFPLFGAPLPVGVSYVQDDTNFEITNADSNSQSVFLSTYGTYNFPANANFVEMTYQGSDVQSSDNVFGVLYSSLFFIFGLGVVISPNTQVGNNGGIAIFPSQRKILGEEFLIDSVVNATGEFILNATVGNLDSIGFNVFDSVDGLGAAPSTLRSQGNILDYDFSVANLTFNFNLGASPVVSISLTTDLVDAVGVAAEIETQIQASNPAYSSVTFTKSQSGIDIQTGYSILISLDAGNLELFYKDSLANSATIDLTTIFPPPLDQIIQTMSQPYQAIFQAAPNSIMSVDFNAGKYAPLIDAPVGAKGFCNVGIGQKQYFYNSLIFIGGGNVAGSFTREITLTNDIAESETPNAVMVYGDFGFSNTIFTTNCFESQIISVDSGVLKEEFSVGLNATLSTEARLRRTGTSGNVLSIASSFPNLNNIVLANSLPDYLPDDASAVCVFYNDFPNVAPDVQFVIKAGLTTVIYDKFRMGLQNDALPYVAFAQFNKIDFPTNDNTPDGNTALIQFNGEDGDYSITDYPTDFLNYNGQDMSGSTSVWNRSAEFAPFYSSGIDQVVNYSNGNKSVEIVNGLSGSFLKAHLPLFVPFAENESILVGFKADIVSGDFLVESQVIQLANVKIVIQQVGANVQYQIFNEFGQPDSTGNLATGYTIQNNDLIYIQFRNTYIEPVVISKVDLFLWDATGSQIYKQINLSYAGSNNAPLPTWSSVVFAGFGNVPASTTAKVSSQCKSADMDSNITSQPEISVGAIDIEGNLV